MRTLEKILLLSVAGVAGCIDYTPVPQKDDVQGATDTAAFVDTGPAYEEACVGQDEYEVRDTESCINIVAVIDGSGSMAQDDDQERVLEFLEWMQREEFPTYSNVQFVVMPADPIVAAGYDVEPVDADEAQTAEWDLSSQTEKPLEALTAYLASDHSNWIDPECKFYFLPFTDEDARGYNQPDTAEGDEAAVGTFVSGILDSDKIDPENFYITATFNDDESSPYCSVSSANVGDRINGILEYFHGNKNDICAPADEWEPYGEFEWGDGYVENVSWPLTHPAVPDTLAVYFIMGGTRHYVSASCEYNAETQMVHYVGGEGLPGGTMIETGYQIDLQPGEDCPTQEER